MSLKSWRIKSFVEKLTTFEHWDVKFLSPFEMANANFQHKWDEWSEYLVYKDIVFCEECGLHLYGWEEIDIPIEEHEKKSPDCLFVKCFKSSIEETKPTNVDIINYWKKEKLMQDFIKLHFYTDKEINEVLDHRLNKFYKFFKNISEIFNYFRLYFNTLKNHDINKKK